MTKQQSIEYTRMRELLIEAFYQSGDEVVSDNDLLVEYINHNLPYKAAIYPTIPDLKGKIVIVIPPEGDEYSWVHSLDGIDEDIQEYIKTYGIKELILVTS